MTVAIFFAEPSAPEPARPPVSEPEVLPPEYTVYSSPFSTPAPEYTTFWIVFEVTYDATTSPSGSTRCRVVPASTDESRVAESQPCPDSVSGATTMPALPAARSVPPSTVKLPLTSSAPLPPCWGPPTTTVPPVISAVPLESKPSPSESRTRVPPVTSAV